MFTDLWSEIASYLPSKYRQNLSLTCRRAQQIVNQTITSCCIVPPETDPSSMPRPTLFIDLLKKFPKLCKIYIRPLRDLAAATVRETIEYLKSSPQNNLSTVLLYECPFKQNPGLNHDWITAWSTPNVTTLTLDSEKTGGPGFDETIPIQGEWQHFPNLQILFLRNVGISSAIATQKESPQSPFIKKLTLSHVSISRPSDFRDFVECFPNIEELSFKRHGFDCETLTELIPDSTKCSSLRSVTFSSCQLADIHSDKVVSLFQEKGFRLRKFTFQDCYHDPYHPIANISYRRVT